jgi:hypothetical protein
MRALLAFAVLLGSIGAADAACKGQVAVRPNKHGIPRQVCLDGKYSTCLRDSRSGGWTEAEARAFCDKRRAAGAVK